MATPASRHGRLRRRSEFLSAAKGLRFNAPAFSLQATSRHEPGGARFGFTVTKKIGNAVERARIRRRLKEAIRTTEGLPVREAHDYVFVARTAALNTPFADLSNQIVRALAEIGTRLDRKSSKPQSSKPQSSKSKKSGTDEVSLKAADRR
ncbi:MAG: ribonuclease P protein component [Methylobacteriaceae bacterium]|nr:ribonuclease P protein component [Methylobacteriaceae bacterium]